MKLWSLRSRRVEAGGAVTIVTELVRAPTERDASVFAMSRNLVPLEIREIKPDETPPDAEILTATPRPRADALRQIAESPLITSPVLTIAFGVVLGTLLTSCIVAIIAAALRG
jgi:hypothetical protein